jgi:hypothetical protein
MITATTLTRKSQILKVDHLVNRGQWFGKTWLIGIQMGFEQALFIVEADNEGDALDTFTDSKYGHLIKTDEMCKYCEAKFYDLCICSYGGNASNRVNLDNVVFHGLVKVNYFAKKEI